ncbi:hypothetical protein GGF46_002942 [Coemansia sp. RSA 552]|nr:hypothetical protein GGF46_002942 [Coemansia sp. RSA 552]
MDKVVFVSECVNVDSLDKCFQDKYFKFISIDSEHFDASAEREKHSFIVLHESYFMVYFANRDPFRCHYQARNLVMSAMGTMGLHWGLSGQLVKKDDGLMVPNQPPMHYFVDAKDADCLPPRNATEDNTIVEYFEHEEDLPKFAEIVKSKEHCVQTYFIVNKGSEYRAVETNNIENTYTFSATLKYRIVNALAAGTATIQTYIDEDAQMAHGDKYLYEDVGGETNDIFLSKEVPPKERRIQIHYADDGSIMLTGWGRNGYAYCDWVKCSYGAIGLEEDEDRIRWWSPMKLQIVRIP